MPRPPQKNRKPRAKEPKEFEEVVLQIARVTRVVKGGRRLRFRATVAIGNRKGKVGLGIGKSNEVSTAIQKAVTQAKKDLLIVPIVKETIPHPVKMKLKASRIMLMPAPLGKGIIAGGSMRPILELAGYKSVLGKRLGTSNLLANAQATIKALRQLTLVPGQEADKNDTQTNNSEKKGQKVQKVVRPAHTFGRSEEKAEDKKEEAAGEPTPEKINTTEAPATTETADNQPAVEQPTEQEPQPESASEKNE